MNRTTIYCNVDKSKRNFFKTSTLVDPCGDSSNWSRICYMMKLTTNVL